MPKALNCQVYIRIKYDPSILTSISFLIVTLFSSFCYPWDVNSLLPRPKSLMSKEFDIPVTNGWTIVVIQRARHTDSALLSEGEVVQE